jgi:hypothetical protein
VAAKNAEAAAKRGIEASRRGDGREEVGKWVAEADRQVEIAEELMHAHLSDETGKAWRRAQAAALAVHTQVLASEIQLGRDANDIIGKSVEVRFEDVPDSHFDPETNSIVLRILGASDTHRVISLIQYAEHALRFRQGHLPDADKLGRMEYTQDSTALLFKVELLGIKAAKQLRSIGHHVSRRPREGIYDTAFQNEMVNSATDSGSIAGHRQDKAEQAGESAVLYSLRYDASTSPDRKVTHEHFGDIWDQHHEAELRLSKVLELAAQIELGQKALDIIKQYDLEVTFNPTGGTYYTAHAFKWLSSLLGGKIVLSWDDVSTPAMGVVALVHEATHAHQYHEGRFPNVNKAKRVEYINIDIGLEAEAYVYAYVAAKQLRKLGYAVPVDKLERARDKAFERIEEFDPYPSVKRDEWAEREAQRAIATMLRDDGSIKRSTDHKTYPQGSGDFWDLHHPWDARRRRRGK